MRKLLIVAALGLAAVVVVATPASGGGRHNKVYAVEDCTNPKPKPKRIVFACADAGLYANHFDWKHWGSRKARAEGVIHSNTCKPSCLGGTFRDYPVEVVLHRIQTWNCNGVSGRFYRKIKLNFPDKHPNFHGFPPSKEVICF